MKMRVQQYICGSAAPRWGHVLQDSSQPGTLDATLNIPESTAQSLSAKVELCE